MGGELEGWRVGGLEGGQEEKGTRDKAERDEEGKGNGTRRGKGKGRKKEKERRRDKGKFHPISSCSNPVRSVLQDWVVVKVQVGR